MPSVTQIELSTPETTMVFTPFSVKVTCRLLFELICVTWAWTVAAATKMQKAVNIFFITIFFQYLKNTCQKTGSFIMNIWMYQDRVGFTVKLLNHFAKHSKGYRYLFCQQVKQPHLNSGTAIVTLRTCRAKTTILKSKS